MRNEIMSEIKFLCSFCNNYKKIDTDSIADSHFRIIWRNKKEYYKCQECIENKNLKIIVDGIDDYNDDY